MHDIKIIAMDTKTVSGFVAVVGSPSGAPIAYEYTATAFQETGVAGTSGTSGSAGTSGSSGSGGSSIFAQTGSFWNTTNNVGITGSFNVNGTTLITGSLIASGSAHTIRGNTSITGSLRVTGSLITTGSVAGNYINLGNIAELATASLNLDNGTFFRIGLPNGNIRVEPSNVKPGQTINILVSNISAFASTISFPSTVKQVSGSAYTPTAYGIDVITLVSFEGTDLYLANIKNFI
jgi:hypothetical protein